MWNNQRMSFKVVGPHYYNNFFGSVYVSLIMAFPFLKTLH